MAGAQDPRGQGQDLTRAPLRARHRRRGLRRAQSSRRPPRPLASYLRLWLLLTLCSLAGLVALNLLVDPFCAYRLVSSARFDRHKLRLGSRTAKAEILNRGQCQVLLLGSSRTEVGLDPEHPAWDCPHVCNAALMSTNFHETGFVFRLALDRCPLRKVVVAPDLFLFTERRSTGNDFDRSLLNPRLSRLEYHLQNLLSLHASRSSINVLLDAASGATTPYVPSGGVIPHTDFSRRDFRQAFDAMVLEYLRLPESYGGFVYGQSRMDVLGEMVRSCRRRGIELVVLLGPAHALELEVIRAAGLWETYEIWKRQMVEVLEVDRREHPGARPEFVLWDFSGYNAYTTEEVPPPGVGRPMRWHVEPSHYRRELGDLVVWRICGRTPPDGQDLEDFGVRLTADNVEAHLARTRAQRQAYALVHPEEIENVRRLAAQAALERAGGGPPEAQGP